MALTLKEKADLANGLIPLAGNSLSFWMQQKLVDYAQDWHVSIRPVNRDVDGLTIINQNLESILVKIDGFSNDVIRIEATGNRGLYNSTTRLMADIIGDSAATLATITAATEIQVETFLDNNILEIFKRGARINRAESNYLDLNL